MSHPHKQQLMLVWKSFPMQQSRTGCLSSSSGVLRLQLSLLARLVAYWVGYTTAAQGGELSSLPPRRVQARKRVHRFAGQASITRFSVSTSVKFDKMCSLERMRVQMKAS